MIVRFESLHLHHSSPDSGELQFKSRGLKRETFSHTEGWLRAGKCLVGFRCNAVEIDPTEKRGVEFLSYDGEWNLKTKRLIPTQVPPPHSVPTAL